MKCVLCKTGETQPGTATVTLERNQTVIVIKDVPADVCQNCGEYYLSQAVTERIYGQAEDAVQRNAEVEFLRYADERFTSILRQQQAEAAKLDAAIAANLKELGYGE